MTPSEVEAQALLRRQMTRARALSDTHIACRLGGDLHHWQSVQPDWKPEFGVAVAKQCTTCNGIKRFIVSRKFGEMLSGPWYEMEDGYYMKRPEDGERGLSASAVRADLLRRQGRVGERPLPPIIPIHTDD